MYVLPVPGRPLFSFFEAHSVQLLSFPLPPSLVFSIPLILSALISRCARGRSSPKDCDLRLAFELRRFALARPPLAFCFFDPFFLFRRVERFEYWMDGYPGRGGGVQTGLSDRGVDYRLRTRGCEYKIALCA